MNSLFLFIITDYVKSRKRRDFCRIRKLSERKVNLGRRWKLGEVSVKIGKVFLGLRPFLM